MTRDKTERRCLFTEVGEPSKMRPLEERPGEDVASAHGVSRGHMNILLQLALRAGT